jgi:5-methylcytosine-specific restriction endonuclease McrA
MERDQEDAEWSRMVKARDHYTCAICGSSGGDLESHHLNCYSKYPDERLDVGNGITLCHTCHQGRFHKVYGKEHTTKYQFEQFMKTAEIFKKLLSSEHPPDFISIVEEEET